MAKHQKHPAKTSDANEDNSTPLTIAELKAIAKTNLRKQVWDYYVSGADTQLSVRRNEKAFSRLMIRPRIMRDVSLVDTSVTLFGKKHSFPVGVSPSAMQKLVGGEGEIDMAKAVADRGTLLTLSSNATTSLEDVIKAPGKFVDFWFQIYISQDRVKSAKLIKRAEAAGYKALAITADTPVLGNRINERKKDLVLPDGMSLINLENKDPNAKERPSLNRQLMQSANKEEAQHISEEAAKYGLLNDASLTWLETIPWLRQQTSMKIIIKGVMTAEDALLAVQHGADAIVVSNHGGRQLDGVPSTIEVLPEIAAAVRGRIPVIFDGGITSGSDVFKALAFGADFTMVGRAPLWGLAYDGRKGVELVLNILERELTRTMALAGAKSVAEITSDMLGVKRQSRFGIAKL